MSAILHPAWTRTPCGSSPRMLFMPDMLSTVPPLLVMQAFTECIAPTASTCGREGITSRHNQGVREGQRRQGPATLEIPGNHQEPATPIRGCLVRTLRQGYEVRLRPNTKQMLTGDGNSAFLSSTRWTSSTLLA